MLRLIGRRLGLSVPLLFIVTGSAFLLVALIPGDVARALLGEQVTREQYLELRDSLGLDEPLPVRYWAWLSHAVQGDLGDSAYSSQPVTTLLNDRLEATFWLVVLATLAATILGVALGIAGALRSGMLGRAVDAVALVGLAIPNFLLGLILVAWFAVAVEVFPATGYVPLGQDPAEWARSLVLPVITLAVPGLAVIAKQTRDAMRDVMERPFVRTLRASGVSRRSIVFKHVLRSAAIPVVTVVGVVFVGILSGTVLVESVFAIPGLGGLAVQATQQHDVPLILGVVVYFTVIVVVMNVLVDLAYGWLDPRVRVA
jgi:peptide/nickel transport system permease protein